MSRVVQDELDRILDSHQAPELDGKVLDELERIKKRGEKELLSAE